ncbi:hypothetical protein SLA2020_421710 [Shorea laevis]
MDQRTSNLLDEVLGLDCQTDRWALAGRVVAIEDSVETSGSFILHQLVKRALAPNSSTVVLFIAFAQPFSHYDRILRKLGCNLAAQRINNRFFFFDKLTLQCPDVDERNSHVSGLVALYGEIQETICGLPEDSRKNVTIIIDDLSIVEVAANGSSDYVLDFLHYCHTLTSEFDCSLITLNHEDIYSSTEKPAFLLQAEYLADILIKAEPLATGLATDVHGQLTVLNKGFNHGQMNSRNKMRNFHFRVKENMVEYFYPGSRN